MPLEHVQPDALPPRAERREAGRNLRRLIPRSLHAQWQPAEWRADPVQSVIEADRPRIARLLPIRYDRMRASPLAFLRGTPAIMAADLAETPTSGLWVQSSGDCHLANFGTFATAEGTPLFDLNDFDETLPAPFEWDVKRLAVSFVLEAQWRGLPAKTVRHLARSAVMAYRTNMHALARMDPLSAWRSRVDVAGVLQGIDDLKLRDRELRRLQASVEASHGGYPKLIERHKGGWRIQEKPPLIFPLGEQSDDTHELVARTAFESYRLRLPEERRALLDRYRLADVAFKVVGIGSVGRFCAIGLYATPDGATLLLQLKEACESVLARFTGPSAYGNHGQRVVVGQRLMQAQPDIFLGWTQERGDDQHCYVRQLKDSRLALIGTDLAEGALPAHATLCGAALARAHARSGDAMRIAGYLGSGGVFDSAVADFALAYAETVERDWRLFLEAIKTGTIEAHPA